MSQTTTFAVTAAVDCHLQLVARLAATAVLGLAVAALETWLRVPVRPLVELWLPGSLGRVARALREQLS